ncbi:MAG: amidohydrolase family protein, partial [Verrucomicrobia bacterium]|nr:amidohydrolase family protein [Verrucomicrobiota bacterium]
YDFSWAGFCSGQLGTKNTADSAKTIHDETGVEVTSIASLRQAMQALFAKYAPCAVAVKAQHAYNRTLHWQERADADADRVLQKKLRGEKLAEDERLCLGDWGWARGVELAIEHNLPFKIHTGFYAGHSSLNPDYIRSGLLAPILKKYPRARFVLMHVAYPYTDELVALGKSFPNAYVDLCWGWGIDPFTTGDFVRRMIHAAPANKLFAFGADTRWPNAAVAYAVQARRWLTRALQAEVDDGLMTEHEAFTFATRIMLANQEECFNLAAKRAAVAARCK